MKAVRSILGSDNSTNTIFNFYRYRYDLYRNSEELFAEAPCSQRREIKRKRYRRKRAGGNARQKETPRQRPTATWSAYHMRISRVPWEAFALRSLKSWSTFRRANRPVKYGLNIIDTSRPRKTTTRFMAYRYLSGEFISSTFCQRNNADNLCAARWNLYKKPRRRYFNFAFYFRARDRSMRDFTTRHPPWKRGRVASGSIVAS